MSTQSFPIDGTLVCLGGYWLPNQSDGGHTAYKLRGVRSEIAVRFRGSSLALLCRFAGQPMQVSVDGGGYADWADPNANAWGTAAVATGLTDDWHTAVVCGKDLATNGFLADAAGGAAVTGSAPAVATPVGYGPAYVLTDPANAGDFVATDPPLVQAGPTVSPPGYDGTNLSGWSIFPATGPGSSGTQLNDGGNDGGVRFRGSTTQVAVWAGAAGAAYTLSRNGTDVATVTVASGGREIGYVVLAAGLDPTAADYVVTPQAPAPAVGNGSYRWVYSVMLSPGATLATPPAWHRLVGFGDSITAANSSLEAQGGSHNGHVYKLAARLGLDPVNRGVSGRTLHDYTGGNGTNLTPVNTALAGVNQAAAVTGIPGRVDWCVVLIGTNDARNTAGVSPPRDASAVQAETATLLSALLGGRTETKYLILGPLDSTDAYASGVTGVESLLPSYRTAIRAAVTAADSPRATYVDTAGWIDPATDTSDGLHPTAAGYDKVVAQLLAVVPTLSVSPPSLTVNTSTLVSVMVANATVGGPAPLAVSGGTGAAITEQEVTDPTHITVTINPGSAAGTLTLTDPASGAAATLTVGPSVMTVSPDTIPAGGPHPLLVGGRGLVGRFTFGGTAGATLSPTGPFVATDPQSAPFAATSPGVGTLAVADASGASATVTVIPAAPAVPTIVPTGSRATVSWRPVTGAAAYRLYRDGTKVYDGPLLTYTDTGLSDGTAYGYTLTAVDAAGHESPPAGPASATPAVPDAANSRPHGPDGPYTRDAVVTPSDTDDLPFVTAALYVGTGGDVNVQLRDVPGPAVLRAVAAGTTLRVRATRVYATATTAGSIVALS